MLWLIRLYTIEKNLKSGSLASEKNYNVWYTIEFKAFTITCEFWRRWPKPQFVMTQVKTDSDMCIRLKNNFLFRVTRTYVPKSPPSLNVQAFTWRQWRYENVAGECKLYNRVNGGISYLLADFFQIFTDIGAFFNCGGWQSLIWIMPKNKKKIQKWGYKFTWNRLQSCFIPFLKQQH